MSFIESIQEQDSLLENSQMQLFINSHHQRQFQQNIKPLHVAKFPAEILSSTRTNPPRKPWETTSYTHFRSTSSIKIRNMSSFGHKSSRLASTNPETIKRSVSSFGIKKTTCLSNGLPNQNIISAMHKINVSKILNAKAGSKAAVGLKRR